MVEFVDDTRQEVSRIIGAACASVYGDGAPKASAGRLARLHQQVWESVFEGSPIAAALSDLRRLAAPLFDGKALMDQCDRRVARELTPVIAACLACGTGDERIVIREIESGLHAMLDAAIADANLEPDLTPARHAA
jgi:hypothetical protein